MIKKVAFVICGLFVLQTVLFAQDTLTPISVIQGDKFRSSLVGKKVSTRGVVTGLRRSGFFIQTPDENVDEDPMTSEGLLIYTRDTPPKYLKIGDLVEVTGNVAEFRPNRELYALFTTEIVDPRVKVIRSGVELPKATEITAQDLSPSGNTDQLEKFEGMRVTIPEFVVVAPTGGREDRDNDSIVSTGEFYGVLKGTARPFREPGLSALTVLFGRIKGVQVFDMNPEIVRVDSDGLNDSEAIDVRTGAELKNLTGIMDYAYGSYTILMSPESDRTVSGGIEMVPASAAAKNEITIASFNVENLFDDEKNSKLSGNETMVSKERFASRLNKLSIAFKSAISYPDVVGIIEVENEKVLRKLRDRLNEDLRAAGRDDIEYESYLKESNDIRGIDVGFLVNAKKVKVDLMEQIAKSEKLRHKDSHPDETLFSRPPILIEASATKSDGSKYEFSVIVNHFKSYRGIDEERSADRVRYKRRLQAEKVAGEIVKRLETDKTEKIFVIGDFNSFQFNDGYNDLIGTLTGKHNKNVLAPAEKAYPTGLLNLVDFISAENRYSYIFDGSAQVLDHVLVTRSAAADVKKFGYVRFNADFPEIYADDSTRPERVSDHDVPVAFVKFDP